MNHQHTCATRNREAMRWVAGVSSSGAFLGTIYGLVRPQPFSSDVLWLAGLTFVAIVLTWVSVETQVACKDEILARMPTPRNLVRATLEEMEEQAAKDAGLPQIAGGERTR